MLCLTNFFQRFGACQAPKNFSYYVKNDLIVVFLSLFQVSLMYQSRTIALEVSEIRYRVTMKTTVTVVNNEYRYSDEGHI